MPSEVEQIEAILREHIRCDATGLAPALASVHLQGIPEAAAAIVALRAQDREDGARESSEISESELAALRTRAITQGASLQRCALVAYELRRRCEAFDEKAALAQGQAGAIGLHEGLRFALTEMGLWDAADLALAEPGEGDA